VSKINRILTKLAYYIGVEVISRKLDLGNGGLSYAREASEPSDDG
jgi:hypothetical protein